MKKIITNTIDLRKKNITSITSLDIFDYEKRKNYDDYRRYKYYAKNSLQNNNNFKNALEEFPEMHNDNYTDIFITNIGIYVFKSSSNFVIYDLLAEDKDSDNKPISFSLIKPDYSQIQTYTRENNPLNVRQINFEGDKFIPTNIYRWGKDSYLFFNADSIDFTKPNDNGYFKSQNNLAISNVEYLEYEIKGFYSIRFIISINGALITDIKDKEGINFSFYLSKKDSNMLFAEIKKGNIETNTYNALTYSSINNNFPELIVDLTSVIQNYTDLDSLRLRIYPKCTNISGTLEVR